jgi:hypothetical protein
MPSKRDSQKTIKSVKKEESQYHTELSFEIDPDTLPIRKASKIKNIVLEEDFYAITWTSLREEVWKNKELYNIKINLSANDHFWIYINFLAFVISIVITFGLILHEVIENKGYVTSTFSILILRITLICFAQKCLNPEFYQGLFLVRYAIKNNSEFSHYQFAIFVGLCQLSVCCVVFFAIILFVCMEDKALQLVVEFAGLTVIAKLDNWLGAVVMCSKIHEISDDSSHRYSLKNFNKRIPLNSKLALIDEHDLCLVDDQNATVKAHWSIQMVEKIVDLLPWQYILPFITIIFNYLLPYLKAGKEEE